MKSAHVLGHVTFGGVKMKKTWFFWLVSLLALCMLFPACEEEDPVGPDSTSYNFVGTWVRHSLTVGGQPEYLPGVDVFRADGTGSSWFTYWDGEEEHLSTSTFTWSLEGEVLTASHDQQSTVTISFNFITDDRVILTFEADGGIWVDERIRWKSERDTRLVGEWEMTAQTQNGTPIEPDEVFVTLNADGTGTYAGEGESSSFNWCTVSTYMLVRESSGIGFSMTYSVAAGNLILTETRDDGTYLMTFSPYEPGETIDPDLLGTWVMEYVTYDADLVDMEGVVTFLINGTGTSGMRSDGDIEIFHFTWSVEDDILYLQEINDEWQVEADYDLTGLMLELFFEQEMHGDNLADVHQVYWKDVSDRPASYVGVWVQSEIFIEEDIVETEVGIRIEADGSMTIAARGYEMEGLIWDDFEDVMERTWSVSEDRVLIMDPATHVGRAAKITMIDGAFVLQHPTIGTRTFIKAEGDNPSEAVGTYAITMMRMNGNLMEPFYMEMRLAADGTGEVAMSHDDEEEQVEVDEFGWLVVGDQVLVFETPGSLYCNVVDYSLIDGVMETSQDWFDTDHGTVYAMQFTYVKNPETVNLDAVGVWVKTGETQDGVEQIDFGEMVLTFVEDGSGSWAEGDESGDFLWAWNDTGYLIAMRMIEEERVAMAYPIQLDGDQLVMTGYWEVDGTLRVVVETFTRE